MHYIKTLTRADRPRILMMQHRQWVVHLEQQKGRYWYWMRIPIFHKLSKRSRVFLALVFVMRKSSHQPSSTMKPSKNTMPFVLLMDSELSQGRGVVCRLVVKTEWGQIKAELLLLSSIENLLHKKTSYLRYLSSRSVGNDDDTIITKYPSPRRTR